MTQTARIALLQLPAFSLEEADESLAHTLRRIDEAARERPDIIALPEVTYPAYFLGRRDLRDCGVLSPAEAAERIASKAREHGVYIAAGLALDAAESGRADSDGRRYTNGALLFGRDGSIVGRYDKSFLYHFDARWFAAGSAYPVFETDVGRIGMLVCADGRLPEIARSLTVNGAQLILDLTAWVSGGRNADRLTSTQREYIMPVRAVENGVWIACVSKFGVEAESIVYCGRSCFIDARGLVVAELGSTEDATLVYDVPVADSAHLPRRPELYEVLSHPTESLPVVRTLREPAVMPESQHPIAVVQVAMPSTGAEFVTIARTHVERLAMHDAEIVVFPATPSRYRGAYAHDETVEAMRGIAADTGVMIAFTVSEGEGGSGMRAMHLVGPNGIVATHRQTHKPDGARFATMPIGDAPSPVVNTPTGRIGLMVAAEGYVPEIARSLMLRGAEIILWCADDPGIDMLPFARCRADENRLWVCAAAAPTERAATVIVDPAGRIAAQALEGRTLAVTATVNPALSRVKTMAPGTDVVYGRQPASYAALTEARVATVI